jgi:hypothetical protein
MTDSDRIRELMLVNLFAVFNQRDAERRLMAIAGNYTDGVIRTDPEGTTDGRDLERELLLLIERSELERPPGRVSSSMTAAS